MFRQECICLMAFPQPKTALCKPSFPIVADQCLIKSQGSVHCACWRLCGISCGCCWERQTSSGVAETPVVQGGISSDLSAATLSVPFTHHFLLLPAGISFSFAGYFWSLLFVFTLPGLKMFFTLSPSKLVVLICGAQPALAMCFKISRFLHLIAREIELLTWPIPQIVLHFCPQLLLLLKLSCISSEARSSNTSSKLWYFQQCILSIYFLLWHVADVFATGTAFD